MRVVQPDLPERIRKGLPFRSYDRKTFYLVGPEQTRGGMDGFRICRGES